MLTLLFQHSKDSPPVDFDLVDRITTDYAQGSVVHFLCGKTLKLPEVPPSEFLAELEWVKEKLPRGNPETPRELRR